ncbi:MAG: type II secretion system protein [Candidatus Margulisiibacteriota bacterium]
MTRRGFTLVELVVALTLFALVAGTITLAFGSYWRNWRKLTKQASLAQIKNLVAERITTDLRAGDPTIAYSYEAGKVQRRKNGTVAYLTSPGEIGRLLFTPLAAKRVVVQLDDLSWEVATP